MNMNAEKLLVALGAAVASSGIARSLSRFEADDLFGLVGLERRRSHMLGALGLLGLGAAVGAGVALMMAPRAGSETRAKLGKEIGKLGEVATEAAREVRAGAPALVARMTGAADEFASQSNASQS